MLLFGVILLMATAAGIIAVIARRNPGIGPTWMIAAGVSLAALLIVAASPARFFPQVTLSGWLPFQAQALELNFRMDRTAWQYTLTILTLNVAMLLTSSVRIHIRNESILWAGSMILSAIGIMACAALTPIALVLAWTLLDFSELGFLLFARVNGKVEKASLSAFTWRVFGTLVFTVVLILSGQDGVPPVFQEIPAAYFPALAMVVILRLGIIPLHQENPESASGENRPMGTIRLIAPSAALVFLGRLSGDALPQPWVWVLVLLTLVYALYLAVKWGNSIDEWHGKSFWLFGAAILPLASLFNGAPEYSATWGSALLIGGAGLFLAVPRTRLISILLLIVFFGISGLPGSPTMASWEGIIPGAPIWEAAGLLGLLTVLFYGFIKFSQIPRGDFSGVDRWVRVVYPFGFVVLILAQWVMFIRGLPGSFSFTYWWCGVLVFLLAMLLYLWHQQLFPKPVQKTLSRINLPSSQKWSRWFEPVFSFAWLPGVMNGIFSLVQRLVDLITDTLEGAGGVLWAILLLALLLSFFQFGFQP